MIKIFIYFYETSIGKIGIGEKDGKITNIYFPFEKIPSRIRVKENSLLKEAANRLEKYLAGNLKDFNLPLAPQGTAFRKNVWQCLCQIPYGQTLSYKELAIKIGLNKGARAVGLANNCNPIPILIPCHRVIGADGSLKGYKGGIQIKKELLALEKKSSNS